MRKMRRFVTVFGLLAAMVLAGCSRELAESERPGGDREGRTLVLTAYAPGTSGQTLTSAAAPGTSGQTPTSAAVPGTKVSVATSGKVTWAAGDEIALYNTSGQKFRATLTGGAGTSQGTFTCSSFSGAPGAVAVYPYALAGSAPGTVTIPPIQERSDATPALMASSFSIDGSEPQDLYFKHIAPVIDITAHDIPAYARALVLTATGLRISGDFSFDTAGPGALRTDAISSSQIITFAAGEGYGTVTKSPSKASSASPSARHPSACSRPTIWPCRRWT